TPAPKSLLPRVIVDRALAILARYVTPPQDVELELWFDRRGNVARIALRGQRLSATVERYAGQELAALSTSDSLVHNRRFTLTFSAAELRAGQALYPSHPKERVPPPPPPPPPPTHPGERAPLPPRPPSHSREYAPRPPMPPLPPKKR
ncbi:MAG: hypothetical protein DRI90_14995, partial [Deltaproteobacteria bacterium]